MTEKYIAYYRVSTKQQGASGLGLSAQKTDVTKFIQGKGRIIAEYTEIESGKVNNRPELIKAIAKAQELNATLIVAKLDRLSRNAGFLMNLKDSGIDLVCADIPEANTLTIGIFATLAQFERETISKRTKAALQAKKAQGAKLGTPANLTDAARQKSASVRKSNAMADPNNRRAAAFIKSERKTGASFAAIAQSLNDNGFVTRRNKRFSAMTVKRLYDSF